MEYDNSLYINRVGAISHGGSQLLYWSGYGNNTRCGPRRPRGFDFGTRTGGRTRRRQFHRSGQQQRNLRFHGSRRFVLRGMVDNCGKAEPKNVEAFGTATIGRRIWKCSPAAASDALSFRTFSAKTQTQTRTDVWLESRSPQLWLRVFASDRRPSPDLPAAWIVDWAAAAAAAAPPHRPFASDRRPSAELPAAWIVDWAAAAAPHRLRAQAPVSINMEFRLGYGHQINQNSRAWYDEF